MVYYAFIIFTSISSLTPRRGLVIELSLRLLNRCRHFLLSRVVRNINKSLQMPPLYSSSRSSISLQEMYNYLTFYPAITIPVEQSPFSLIICFNKSRYEYDIVTWQLVIVSISAALQEQYHYR